MYDLLGFDKSKYDLELKVVYQSGGGIIAPTVISNDQDSGFFLDEIFISIQHRTSLCVLVVEKTILAIPNPTQDIKIPSFVPETAEAEKVHGHEVVPRQSASKAPINNDPKVEPPFPLIMSWGGWKTCVKKNSQLALVKI